MDFPALDSHGFPLAPIFAWLAGLAEFLGGILIAIGLATRLSACLANNVVAIFIWHVGDPFSKIESCWSLLCNKHCSFNYGRRIIS